MQEITLVQNSESENEITLWTVKVKTLLVQDDQIEWVMSLTNKQIDKIFDEGLLWYLISDLINYNN